MRFGAKHSVHGGGVSLTETPSQSEQRSLQTEIPLLDRDKWTEIPLDKDRPPLLQQSAGTSWDFLCKFGGTFPFTYPLNPVFFCLLNNLLHFSSFSLELIVELFIRSLFYAFFASILICQHRIQQLGGGRRETWNLCGCLWRPSFLWLTGRELLIWSHSSARFCFELSRNSN